MPSHPTDPSLEDGALMSEIQLLADLIITATANPGSLSQTSIDEVLGIRRLRTARA